MDMLYGVLLTVYLLVFGFLFTTAVTHIVGPKLTWDTMDWIYSLVCLLIAPVSIFFILKVAYLQIIDV